MIKKLGELNLMQRDQFVDLFTDCFIKDIDKDLKFQDQEKVIFADAFIKDYAAAYLVEEKVAGLVAFSNMEHSSVRFSRELCIKQAGKIFGSVFYWVLKNFFEKPTARHENEGYIDFLCVNKNYRRRGIASKLLDFAYKQEQKPYYILGVLSKNENAIRLYEKQGYKKTHTRKGFFIWLFLHDSVDMMRLERI